MGRPYDGLQADELILRDHLALSRTTLANERTVLAYARTAIALLAAGVSFIELFDSPLIAILGWVFVPLGVATAVLGLRRYLQVRSEIAQCTPERQQTVR